jgi:hypothetical protein
MVQVNRSDLVPGGTQSTIWSRLVSPQFSRRSGMRRKFVRCLPLMAGNDEGSERLAERGPELLMEWQKGRGPASVDLQGQADRLLGQPKKVDTNPAQQGRTGQV